MGCEMKLGVVVLVVLMVVLQGAGAEQLYVVGGASGWNMPAVSKINYQLWAQRAGTYVSGDKLKFNYNAEMHDVVEVDAAHYAKCSAASTYARYNDGQTVVTLTGPRKYYFICSVPSHCAAGMQLEVNVRA